MVSPRRWPRPKRVAAQVAVQAARVAVQVAVQVLAVRVLAAQVLAVPRVLEAVRGRPVAAVPPAAEVLVPAAVLPDRAVAAE